MYFWFDLPHPLSRFGQKPWFFRAKCLCICALLLMSVGGLLAIRRKRREYFWLLVSFPAVFPLVYYVTLARDVHRFPIDPVLAIIAAFAVTAWLPPQPQDGNTATLRVGIPDEGIH